MSDTLTYWMTMLVSSTATKHTHSFASLENITLIVV